MGKPRHPHAYFHALFEFQKEQAEVDARLMWSRRSFPHREIPPLPCDLTNEYDPSDPFTARDWLVDKEKATAGNGGWGT